MATDAEGAEPLLVYLDTANLATYAGASAEDRAAFRASWEERRAMLALSFVHVIEVRQHASAPERDARYTALADFLPMRTTMSLANPQEKVTDASDREMLAAAARRGLPLDAAVAGISIAERPVRVTPFPWTLETLADLDPIREAESDWFAERVADMRAAVSVGTEALVRPKGSSAPVHRLAELSDIPYTPAQTAYLLAQFYRLMKPPLQSVSGGGEVTAAVLDSYRRLTIRSAVVGPRRAQAERLEADLGRPLTAKDLNRPLWTLAFEASFRRRVRDVLALHCSRAPAADRAAVADAIQMRECPGRWLWHAVVDHAYKAEAEPALSNYWDFDQVMFLPYVDRFFTDKRIATFVTQALRSPDRPTGLTAASLRRNSRELQQIAGRLA